MDFIGEPFSDQSGLNATAFAGSESSTMSVADPGCRNLARQQVGSYSGHSGCGANAVGKAARDLNGSPAGSGITGTKDFHVDYFDAGRRFALPEFFM
jgi:hypothetical protein